MEETITILKVGTDEAIKNISDLRNNIKALKEGFVDANGEMHKGLNDLEIGTQEYQDTLEELKINQAAVKDAMFATTASMEDLAKAATGTSESYNSLVHRMAALKEELRNVDVSTEAGQKRFNDLASQVRGVNDRLKELDAAQGNHQRNVGNYQSALDNLSGKFKTVAGSASGVINPIANVTKGLKVLSATPVIGILGLLANVLTQVIGSLKTSEENTNRVSNAMSVFAGIGDSVTKLMQGLGKAVAWVAEKFASVYESVFGLSEAMKERNEITEQTIALAQRERDAIVKNAEAEREVAELKANVNDTINYSVEERLKFLERANQLEEEISKREYENLKTQYEIIKAKNALTESSAEDLKKEAEAYAAMVKAETAYYNAIRENNSKISSLRKESVKETKTSVKTTVEEIKTEVLSLDDVLKTLAETERALDEDRKERLAEQAELDAMTLEQTAELTEEIDNYFEELHQEELRRMQEEIDMAERTAQAKIDTLFSVANATSSIMSSIADIYEQDGENNKKSAQKAKNIRAASATIDTISGAVAGFMQYQKQGIPQPYATILGAAQAATITAAGMAQVAKIRSTKVDSSSSSSTPAVITAPARGVEIPQMRSVTSASEEDRFNQMASDQRVVLVMSDLEVKNNQTRVQMEESSF